MRRRFYLSKKTFEKFENNRINLIRNTGVKISQPKYFDEIVLPKLESNKLIRRIEKR